MKYSILLILAVAAGLSGCEETPITTYHLPLTSPGGQFSKLPPAVQNSVRAESGMAEISHISKETSADSTIYVFQFRNAEVYPPLYVASDGSVLDSELVVVVPATAESIAASTSAGSNGIKLDDLPPPVMRTIHSHAPTAEVDSIERFTAGNQVFYDVYFKDPEHHPKMMISDDGRVVR
jgi:hypothetical protein